MLSRNGYAEMIDILLDHPWFLVINKPSGLLTQAVPGVDSVQTMLVEQLRRKNGAAPTPFIGMPHRLDRVTTGAMVVARNQRALRRLSDQFAQRIVKKTYHAIVPKMVENEGRWIDWMRKVPEKARSELVDPSAVDAKQAVLKFHVISNSPVDSNSGLSDVCLVEIELETGRMHQIRIQFGSRGYPILGDVLYGSELPWIQTQTDSRESPIALHAAQVEFRNPQNGEFIAVSAPYPSTWPPISNAGPV
jgi:23S rRNA pseudouridine1911/1915/1917 synthase